MIILPHRAMTRGNTAQLPLVLRQESFGGILFDPSDGTTLELDTDGYVCVRDWLCGSQGPLAHDQRDFVSRVQAEVPSLAAGPRPFRLRDALPAAPPYRHATVLVSPTLVDLQVTRRCRMGCPHCYASSDLEGAHMPYPDAAGVLRALADAGVCQLAIGGGEPLLHPELVEIVEQAHALGIVPNLTTTGDGMTPRHLEALSRCCGAVALSLEAVGNAFSARRRAGFSFFQSAREKLRAYGIPTVFQVTLSAENLPHLPSIVDYCLACPDLYGVIFLAYKPVGRGNGFNTSLSAVSPAELYPQLRDAFLRLVGHTRVGYDCCLTPGIAGIDVELGFSDRDLLEGCSAARTSVGITVELDVVPCTFATHRPMGNLRERSFMQIWHGPEAAAFRSRLDALGDRDGNCRACVSRKSCLGGCPEWDLIGCTLVAAGSTRPDPSVAAGASATVT